MDLNKPAKIALLYLVKLHINEVKVILKPH